jgi:hypothetical protein
MKIEIVNELPPAEFAKEVLRGARKELLGLVEQRKLAQLAHVSGVDYRTLHGIAGGEYQEIRWEWVVKALAPLGYRVQLAPCRHFLRWEP